LEHRVDTYCREVTENRPNIIIKKKQTKKRKHDRRGNTSGQESHAEAERELQTGVYTQRYH